MCRTHGGSVDSPLRDAKYEGKPSHAVVTVIADLPDASPLELPPLSELVRAEGVDISASAVVSPIASAEDCDCEVTVTPDTIRINDADV